MNGGGADMSQQLVAILDAFQSIQRQIVLLHLSDEMKQSPTGMYSHPAIKHVFRNYWKPALPADKVSVVPLGFAKGRSGLGLSAPPAFKDREYVWSFAGSLDRMGRVETLNVLTQSGPHFLRTNQKWGDPVSVPAPEYCEMLRKTKFVPCLRGFHALESFRIYEALEHGAIPVYVPTESDGCSDEMRQMYGADHPFIAIPSWEEATKVLPTLAANVDIMELHRQKVAAWWVAKKDELRKNIKAALIV